MPTQSSTKQEYGQSSPMKADLIREEQLVYKSGCPNRIHEALRPTTSPQHEALTEIKTQASASCLSLLADQLYQ